MCLALAAMATRFELVLGGDDPVRLRGIGEAALREIADCESVISPFVRGSMIARVNREAHARPVRVDSLTFGLLQQCAALSLSSGGAFDITVGPLLRALGFRSEPAADKGGLAAARTAVGMQHVELDPQRETVRFLQPGMAIDLGAIGKGFALDLAAAVLREHGVTAALLHGGTSSVLAIGAPPGLPGWRIGIGPWPEPPVALLRDAALSVSAGHGRVHGGQGHVLDPRSGRAVASDVAAAAVLAGTATLADGWSTALCVLGHCEPFPDSAFLVARGTAALQWQGTGDRMSAIDFRASVRSAGSPS